MEDTNPNLNPSPLFQDKKEQVVRPEGTASVFSNLFHSFGYYLRQIWPYIYRLINFLVYETIKVIKGTVKLAIEQVGMFK
ncbi:MAG TPA: hypothetical protein PKA38_01415 [Candidatus Levybacteria bacterium]|nr:hypothetical protein [Candidatus Levybacteria bacterium]